jgi:hypothetical protein
MMHGLREQLDADRFEQRQALELKSETHRFEIPCSACGRPLYVEEDTMRALERSTRQDLDNGFMCTDCEQEYDRLAFE